MITLEEIAGYLPYKVKFKSKEGGSYYPWPYHGDHEFIFDFIETPNNIKLGHGHDWIGTLLKDFRPALRPLSDLTKEIEHNGEKFVPIVELANTMWPAYKWEFDSCGFATAKDTYLNRFIFEYDLGYNSFSFDGDYCMDQLKMYTKLYEWHFWLGDQSRFSNDIIDINTL